VSRELESPKPEAMFNISNEETVRRLRTKGQPVRLFGESDKDRRLRLRALELIEEKDHERQGGQNDFKKALEDVESVERELRHKNDKGKRKEEANNTPAGILDLSLLKTDSDKLYPMIYYALKRTLKDWEETLDERPGFFPIMCCPSTGLMRARSRQAVNAREIGRGNSSSVSAVP
jgi:pre-mRNA-splicing factor 18